MNIEYFENKNYNLSIKKNDADQDNSFSSYLFNNQDKLNEYFDIKSSKQLIELNTMEIQSIATRICSLFILELNGGVKPISKINQLIGFQEFLSKLCYISGFKNFDHLIDVYLNKNSDFVLGEDVVKIFMFTTTETQRLSEIEKLRDQNPSIFLATVLMMVWGCSGTEIAAKNREWAYQQIEIIFQKFPDVEIPEQYLHGYFMMSSYGFSKNKHNLKKYINEKLAHKYGSYLKKNSYLCSKYENKSKKPIIFIIPEFINDEHSVYRVLGMSLKACRTHFHVVWITIPTPYLNVPEDLYDDHIQLSASNIWNAIKELENLCKWYKPKIILYPSIGMSPWIIYFSNLRFAPIQINAIGHGASSFAKEIDYYIIEEDIAGFDSTYSEKLIKLPPGSMPFLTPELIEYKTNNKINENNKNVVVACCAAPFKINHKFLTICKSVHDKYKYNLNVNIIFRFFVGGRIKMQNYLAFRKMILEYIKDAEVYYEMPFQEYVNNLSKCDITLSPFPYGNMNGIIDAAKLGIPGVCMVGENVHESIDAGMFKRMGLPDWLIANTELEYEQAIYRLIEDQTCRNSIKSKLLEEKKWMSFFNGNPNKFSEKLLSLLDESTNEFNI